ncbi:MAG TPA: hypothetical protein VIY27_14570 [Myxococcota bacterium]
MTGCSGRGRTWVGAFVGLVAGVALGACVWLPQRSGPASDGAWAVRRIASAELGESSGLVASPAHPGVFWTHHDSGDSPRLFAIDADGALLGAFPVAGATHRDWEDIAADGAGHLYIGDIGNNANDRRDLVVYRVSEPDPHTPGRPVRVDRALRFRYADQVEFPAVERRNFDAEALFWMDDALYLFTKHRSDTETTLYRLPVTEGVGERALEPVARVALPARGRMHEVTGADLQPVPRGLLALLTYGAIHLFERDASTGLPFRPIHRIALDVWRTGQVESIAWDGDALLFGNEARALFRIPDPLSIERYPP